MRHFDRPYWPFYNRPFEGVMGSFCEIPRFRCEECRTVDGCERHQIFRCQTCSRPAHWADGAADDRPGDCADCWHAWWEPMSLVAQGLAQLLDPSC